MSARILFGNGIGNHIQDDPEDGFSSTYPRSGRGQALRKQVSILWIPAFAGMTRGERE